VPEVLSLCIGLDQLRLVDYPFENVPHQRELVGLEAVHDAVAQRQIRY